MQPQDARFALALALACRLLAALAALDLGVLCLGGTARRRALHTLLQLILRLSALLLEERLRSRRRVKRTHTEVVAACGARCGCAGRHSHWNALGRAFGLTLILALQSPPN